MTTPVFLTSWNHGVTPNTNGGGLANSLVGDVTVVSNSDLDTSYALQVKPTASAAAYLGKNTSGTAIVARVYVYISVAPASGVGFIFWPFFTTSTNSPTVALRQSDTKFVLVAGLSGSVIATGPSYVTGRWYIIDQYVDCSANPWVCKTRVTDTTTGTATDFDANYSAAADSNVRFEIGTDQTGGPAYTCLFKHYILSQTLADYPIGAGRVIGLSPNGDGTHNAGTNTIEDNAGTDIGATAAYDKVNEVPMNDNTDYLRQATAGTGNYAEVTFPDLVSGQEKIDGVMGVIAYTSATTSANQAGVGVMDGSNYREIFGNPTTRADFSDGSTTNLFYKSAMITLATKDKTSVDALKARFGYSNDVSPNPYLMGIMLEVGYSNERIGQASITEAADTLSAAGVVAVAGTANISEAGDSISAGGAVAVAGVASITEAGDTLSAAGVVPVAGAANITEDADTISAAGVALVAGTANITEDADIVSAVGTVLISGDANITEGADTLNAMGVVAVFGIAIITEDGDTLIGVGIVEGGETGPVLGVNDTPGFVLFMTASAFYYLLKNAGEDVGLDAPGVDNAEAWAQWLNGN